jgi:AraC-like DNA-binding protein
VDLLVAGRGFMIGPGNLEFSIADHRVWLVDAERCASPRLLVHAVGTCEAAPRSGLPGTVTLVAISPWFLEQSVGGGGTSAMAPLTGGAKALLCARATVAAAADGERRHAVLGGLVTALCRSLPALREGRSARKDDAWLNPFALRRVLGLVEDDIGGDLRVGSLAGASGLSPSAFLRAFRGSLGSTPGEYVTARRLARAEALIADTTIPIADIARICGFATPTHFSTIFKARRSLSPATVRCQVQYDVGRRQRPRAESASDHV